MALGTTYIVCNAKRQARLVSNRQGTTAHEGHKPRQGIGSALAPKVFPVDDILTLQFDNLTNRTSILPTLVNTRRRQGTFTASGLVSHIHLRHKTLHWRFLSRLCGCPCLQVGDNLWHIEHKGRAWLS